MQIVEQELFTLPEHMSSTPVFSGVRVTRSLVLCVCFVDRCLSFCTFFFWPLCCLFFDIRILITPLVFSNSSCMSFVLQNIHSTIKNILCSNKVSISRWRTKSLKMPTKSIQLYIELIMCD